MDVLDAAYTQQHVNAETADQQTLAEQLLQAGAAVSALIAADVAYDDAVKALADLNRRIADEGWLEVEHDALRIACRLLARAKARRADALDRCQGIAP